MSCSFMSFDKPTFKKYRIFFLCQTFKDRSQKDIELSKYKAISRTHYIFALFLFIPQICKKEKKVKITSNISSFQHLFSLAAGTRTNQQMSSTLPSFHLVHCRGFAFPKQLLISTQYIHSNLDIVNKSVRPFLFTISNNSLYQM